MVCRIPQLCPSFRVQVVPYHSTFDYTAALRLDLDFEDNLARMYTTAKRCKKIHFEPVASRGETIPRLVFHVLTKTSGKQRQDIFEIILVQHSEPVTFDFQRSLH